MRQRRVRISILPVLADGGCSRSRISAMTVFVGNAWPGFVDRGLNAGTAEADQPTKAIDT